jgi:hypothetical protein
VQVRKVGLMILDQRFMRRLDMTKMELVQERDSNLDHIMRSKGR